MCSGDFSVTLRKRRFDALTFVCLMIGWRGARWLWLVRHPAFVDREFVRLRDDERALNYVLQFADIPRPGILLQHVQSLLLNMLDLFARSFGITIDKIIYQQGNVPFTFA